jgi:alkanesulfonate monooxygenase SsuD/methylene tetrahydromethanopterin reductase-like flavin-dependent oxidoreductase (luciferase family)
MWMACTNRDTIKIAASNGLGALAFSFIDELEARTWSKIYYDIIKSDDCVPLGHSVNANVAMVSAFSLNADAGEAARRGQEGFEFFRYAISALVSKDTIPGRSRLYEQFESERSSGGLAATVAGAESLASAFQRSRGIGTPAEFREHVLAFEAAGIDQIILLQQAGRNKHEHICESLELLAREVLGEFTAESPARERRKDEELAPFIAKALARKKRMPPLAEADIPVVRASVSKPVVNQSGA